jgi:2-hydroxy-6-oxonona-2,4-dienedioate hydrolase
MRNPQTATSRTITVGGLDVHVWVVGAGEPVVLVHGYAVSGRYMLPLAQSLACHYTVLTPELPGFGRSQKPQVPLRISGLADALADCLDALGLERPAFVANSMGCQVVTELAVSVPERVGPLTLIGPTVDPEQRLARRQLRRALGESVREPLPLLSLAARDGLTMGVGALLATARSVLADRIEERLPLIDQPTLVVCGERDQFVSREWRERVTALLPRGRLAVVPREPHAVHFTRPGLVSRLVRELLVEEAEETGGQLVRSLPHRYVAAGEEDEARAGQDPLPLRSYPRRYQPVVLAPDQQGGRSNGREVGAHVPARNEDHSMEEAKWAGSNGVAEDRRKPLADVIEGA